MKATTLIQKLQAIVADEGDIEVLLHVFNHATEDDIYHAGDTIECIGDVTDVRCEDDHSDGSMFIRLMGDDEE